MVPQTAKLSDIGCKGKSKRVTNSKINMTVRGIIHLYCLYIMPDLHAKSESRYNSNKSTTSGYTGGENERSNNMGSLAMLRLNRSSRSPGLQVYIIAHTLATGIMKKTIKNLLDNLLPDFPMLIPPG